MSTTEIPDPITDPGPKQWSQAGLTLAAAEGRWADIVAAREAGQLRDLLNAAQRNPNARSSMIGNKFSPTTGEPAKKL